LIIGLLVAVMSGCATPPAEKRAPVEERGSRPPVQEIRPVPLPKQPVEQSELLRPHSPAVRSLQVRAQQETAAGRLENASALLERALRIENRAADLWYQLAKVRYRQGEYVQATHLLRRANDYAGNDRQQLRRDWRLLLEIHQARGDEVSILEAQRRLRELGSP